MNQDPGLFVSESMINRILRKCIANCEFSSGHIWIRSLSAPNLIRAIFESHNKYVQLEVLDVDPNLKNLNQRLHQRGVGYGFTVVKDSIGVYCQLVAREVILTSNFEGMLVGAQNAVVKADLFNCNPLIHNQSIYRVGCQSGSNLFFTRLIPQNIPTSEAELLDIVNDVFANSTFTARSRVIVPVFNWSREFLLSMLDGVILSNPESQKDISLFMPYVKVQISLTIPEELTYQGQEENLERFDEWPVMIYCEKDGHVIWAYCQV